MTKKKKASKTILPQSRIIVATLKLMAQKDWGNCTLGDIATLAKVPQAAVQKTFQNKDEILPLLVEYFDSEVSRAIGKNLEKGTPEDRLFEVMMARFDVIQSHRTALLRFLHSVKHDPSPLRFLVPAQMKSMQKMLCIAGLGQEEPQNTLAVLGLGAVYLASLYCWQKDHSKDMTATMASLDRGLKRAEKLAKIVMNRF